MRGPVVVLLGEHGADDGGVSRQMRCAANDPGRLDDHIPHGDLWLGATGRPLSQSVLLSVPDHRLVLITGAGASRSLGVGDRLMPLMNEWSDLLRSAFDNEELGLAEALGLRDGLTGADFEATLGQYLAWEQSLPLIEQFFRLGSEPGHGLAPRSDILNWLQIARGRVPRVRRVLNDCLWTDFGIDRIDARKATETYRRLCDALFAAPTSPNTEIFSATTNYDRSGEDAWRALGFTCDTGMRSDGLRTPFLQPDGVEPWGRPLTVAHLHLHGAVGWYRDGARIRVDPADQPYDDRRTPAVLYPDPDKDPFAAGGWGAAALWAKLDQALSTATHVLVLGHSLHDGPLVSALARAARGPAGPKFALCHHVSESSDGLIERITGTSLRSSDVPLQLFPIDFGPEGDFGQLQRWMVGG